MEKQKIIIADNNKYFREGFKTILHNIGGVEIVGEASNGEELLKMLSRKKVDIVFTDLNMPVMNGVEVVKIAHDEHPDVTIIAFTSLENKRYVSKMVAAGVNGYLSKGRDNFELFREIIENRHSGFFISPDLAQNYSNKILVS